MTQRTRSTRGSSASTVWRWSTTTESVSGRSRSASQGRRSWPTLSPTPRSSRRRTNPGSGLAGIHPRGSPVVGRMPPERATSSPARALMRLDLPDPVPPATATTSVSPRYPARSRTRRTVTAIGSRTSGSTSSRAAAITRSKASTAAIRSLRMELLGGDGDDCGRVSDLLGDIQRVRGNIEYPEIPARLRGEHLPDGGEERVPGGSRQRPGGCLAEHVLEYPLLGGGGPGGDTELGPGQATRGREHGEDRGHGGGVDTGGGHPGRTETAGAFRFDQGGQTRQPPVDHRLGLVGSLGTGDPEVGGEKGAPRVVDLPCGGDGAGRALEPYGHRI